MRDVVRTAILGAAAFMIACSCAWATDLARLENHLIGTWELFPPQALVTGLSGTPRLYYPQASAGTPVAVVSVDTLRTVRWKEIVPTDGDGVDAEVERRLQLELVRRPDGRQVVVLTEDDNQFASWSCWIVDSATVVLISPPGLRNYPRSLLEYSYIARRLPVIPGTNPGDDRLD